MPFTKASDFRHLSDEEIEDNIIDLKKDLFGLRFRQATRQIVKPHEFKELRRQIAQLMTIANEREIQLKLHRHELISNGLDRFIYQLGKVSFPKKIKLGKVAKLEVVFDSLPEHIEESDDIKDADDIEVSLIVSPYYFDLVGNKKRSIKLSSGEEPSIIKYELSPKNVGKADLGLDFFQNANYLGGVKLNTDIIGH